MCNLVFNVEEALEFSKKGKIEEWVHLFLNSIGNNKALSAELKSKKRYWKGPILMKLEKLNRCCGPEKYMKFRKSIKIWEKSVSKMQQSIREGWDMPPLIVKYHNNHLIVMDGNHRIEALQREEIDEFWVVIWDNHSLDNLGGF